MARKYKRTLNLYPAWSYQNEIEEFDGLSEQGWQLIRGGTWINKSKRDPLPGLESFDKAALL